MNVNAYAAQGPKGQLNPFSYSIDSLGDEEVLIKIHYCGICHSDLSMLNNDWGISTYPFVPGHEIIGEIVSIGCSVNNLKLGDKVGLGWFSESCMYCQQCLNGEQHLCASKEETIVGRHGGFADYTKAHWSWVIPLPNKINLAKAGPLLCGGITVFNPIVASNVSPTDTVGVIGIGGLGHLAIKFLKHWGCEVIAFSSNPNKKEQILEMGASKVIDSTNPDEFQSIQQKLNFLLNTTNISLDWNAYISTLAPKGKLHHVGAVLEPMKIPAFSLISGEKTIGGSPLGSPALTRTMLNFCVRHQIYPDVEEFPMSKVNEALKHLELGKARYRIVLNARK